MARSVAWAKGFGGRQGNFSTNAKNHPKRKTYYISGTLPYLGKVQTSSADLWGMLHKIPPEVEDYIPRIENSGIASFTIVFYSEESDPSNDEQIHDFCCDMDRFCSDNCYAYEVMQEASYTQEEILHLSGLDTNVIVMVIRVTFRVRFEHPELDMLEMKP